MGWLARRPRLTLAALVESALRRELERLKKAHNDGKPWPPVTERLVGGRPGEGGGGSAWDAVSAAGAVPWEEELSSSQPPGFHCAGPA